MTTPKSYPSKHYRHFRKGIAFPFPFSGVRAMSTLPFQGGVIFRTFVLDSGFGTYAMSEEVGQLIRRIWANLSTNQIAPFSSCSHEAFAIENLHRAHKYRLFSYCCAHFFGNFTRYYFYNSESTHWKGILKGKRYFPVYFDLSI
jgi:hypothetical protein